MGNVLLQQLKPGSKIAEDVLTPLGSILIRKGKIVTDREIEIMQAFLVPSVVIDDPTAVNDEREESSADHSAMEPSAPTTFDIEYEQMIEVMRKAFNSSIPGQGMPIMDIRTQLEKLLQHIKSFNALSFAPRHFLERDYLLHKSVASSLTSYLLAQWVGLPQKEWMQVALAGLLKDIGNVRIDKSILEKPLGLTTIEKDEIKRHTVYGYQLLKNIAALNEGVKLTALQHHEKIDGSGYPLGIDSSQIHPYAKIVSIADIFHAMTLNKAYRKAASPYLVLEQIQSDSFGKLDPGYVGTFLSKVTQFNIGTLVKLSDDRVGEIVFSDRTHPTRPWVSINSEIVNLITDRHLFIKEVLQNKG